LLLGGVLFLTGLVLIYRSRSVSWNKKEHAWKNGREPGSTDWRWAIPGIIAVVAGMAML
jgi:hypothetical protein